MSYDLTTFMRYARSRGTTQQSVANNINNAEENIIMQRKLKTFIITSLLLFAFSHDLSTIQRVVNRGKTS